MLHVLQVWMDTAWGCLCEALGWMWWVCVGGFLIRVVGVWVLRILPLQVLEWVCTMGYFCMCWQFWMDIAWDGSSCRCICFCFVCGEFVLVFCWRELLVLSLAFSVAGFQAKCGEVVVGWLFDKLWRDWMWIRPGVGAQCHMCMAWDLRTCNAQLVCLVRWLQMDKSRKSLLTPEKAGRTLHRFCRRRNPCRVRTGVQRQARHRHCRRVSIWFRFTDQGRVVAAMEKLTHAVRINLNVESALILMVILPLWGSRSDG